MVVLLAATFLMVASLAVYAQDDRQGIPDPLLFSTFVGGSDADWPHTMVVAPNGTIYVTGYTLSYDFITTDGAYQRMTQGNEEVFVLALSADGSKLLWSTLVGGSGQDIAWDMALDTDGQVYVTGSTRSADFPTTQGAYQRTMDGTSDAFVICLAPDGGSLVYSTLLGAENDEQGYGIEALADGRAVVVGHTESLFFPTTQGAYDRALSGISDVFLARLSADGTSLQASTYLGGSYTEWEPAMAINGSGDILVTGSTTSQDFPTTAGLPNDWDSGRDVFITLMRSDMTDIVRSMVMGRMGNDVPRSVDLGPEDEVMVAGITNSPEFPDTGNRPGNDNSGLTDGFVLQFTSSLAQMEHGWLYGGTNFDVVRTARYGANGLIHVVGYTNSTDFPTTSGSYKPYKARDDHDMFYMQVDPTRDFMVLNSTYIGKGMGDFGMDLDFDRWGVPVIVGHTRSPDFPLGGDPYDDTYEDNGDMVILRYTTDEEPPEFSNNTTPEQVETGANITFSIEVTDMTGLLEVWLVYEEGTGDYIRSNSVLLEGDGTYTHTHYVSPVVYSLSYEFMSWDVLGHFSESEIRTIDVIDIHPPELVSDDTAETGMTGDPFLFKLHVKDNWQVEAANLEYSIGDRHVKASMDKDFKFAAINEYWNLTIHMADDSLDPISYRFHFWDRSNNAVRTIWKQVLVLDDDAPVLNDMMVPLHAQPGTTITVSVGVWDNIGVHRVRLDYYETMAEVETVTVTGPYGQTIEVEVPIPLEDGELHVVFYVEDAASNMASIAGVVPFRDEEPPQMHITHDNTTTTGGVFSVSLVAIDPAGIQDMWGFYVFGEDHVLSEYTYFPLDGRPLARYEIDIPEDITEALFVILAARDVYRNENQTDPIRISVLDDDPPIADAGQLYVTRQGITVYLDARDSADNIGIVRYEWSWVIPGTSNEEVLNSTEPNISLSLTEKGEYNFRLVVHDDAGNRANDSVIVLFTEQGQGDPAPVGPWAGLWIWLTTISVACLVIAGILWQRSRKKGRRNRSGET